MAADRAMRVDVRRELRVRVRVDHRADVGREQRGVADHELVHRSRAAGAARSSAVSSCRQSRRSAEQRCPALSNADCAASRTTCSGSAELSTIIAFWPPVSAISVAIGAGRARERAVDRLRRLDGAGEHDAGDARIGDERLAELRAVARAAKCSALGRDAGLVQQLHR